MKWTSILWGSVLSLAAFAASAGATPITGTFDATGTYTYASLGSGNFSLDFGPVGLGNGTDSILAGPTGYFNQLVPPASTMNILDMASSPSGAGFVVTPVGTPISVPNFLSGFTAATYGTLTFELNLIRASLVPVCTGAEVVNQSCAGSAGSAFTLTRRLGGVDVDFLMVGTFRANGGADVGSNANAVFTTTFAGLTVPDVLNLLAAAGSGGITAQSAGVAADYSATFTATAVPEPSSMLLLGTGLAAACITRKRRKTA